MTVDVEPWLDPAQQQSTDCPLCGAPSYSCLVVGTRARFGMPVRSVACERCGLVRVSPRPTPEAMDAYYRGPYREHYKSVRIPGPDGTFAAPGEPGYQAARTHIHGIQAKLSRQLGQLEAGARVLEVGCHDAETLAILREIAAAEVCGVEPDGADAEAGRQRGVDVFAGLLEEYSIPDDHPGFDLIQMFHVLEHLHEPLDTLLRLMGWLKPGGRLLIQVPNLTRPYGSLQDNFFQNAHLFCFSPNTLTATLRRVGLEVETLLDDNHLTAVGRRPEVGSFRADEAESPSGPRRGELLPFDEGLLPLRGQDGLWVAERLETYDRVETLRSRILSGRFGMKELEDLAVALERAAFDYHTRETVGLLLTHFGRVSANSTARVVLQGVIQGPHAEDLKKQCRDALGALARCDQEVEAAQGGLSASRGSRLLLLNTPSQHLGDYATFSGLVNLLGDASDELGLELEVDQGAVDDFRFTSSNLDRILTAYDLIILTGGRLLDSCGDRTASGWAFDIRESLIARLTVPFAVFAAGHEHLPRADRLPEALSNHLSRTLAHAAHFSVREEGTLQLVSPLDARSIAQCIPDPALALHAAPMPLPGIGRRTIAVSFAADSGEAPLARALCQALATLVEEDGVNVLFAPIRFGAAEATAARLLRATLPVDQYSNLREVAPALYTQTDPQQAALFTGVFQRVGVVVGQTPHSLLLPFNVGTPALSLGVADTAREASTNRWIHAMLGMPPELHLDEGDAQPPHITELVRRLFRERAVFQQRSFLRRAELDELARGASKAVLELIPRPQHANASSAQAPVAR